MSILSKPSSVARVSVIYITVGAIIDVWSGIWFFYLRNNTPVGAAAYYWCYGFLLTGLALVLIGLIIGRIGWIGGDVHQAELHHAELHRAELHREDLHREEVSHAAAQAQATAAKAGVLEPVGQAEIPMVTEAGKVCTKSAALRPDEPK
jgi:hypothetical protein